MTQITTVSIHPYKVPFVSPVRIDGTLCAYREGFYVELTSSSGTRVYGDCAPLSSRNQPLSEIKKQLDQLAKTCKGTPIATTSVEMYDFLRHFLPQPTDPSIKFAFETAFFQFIAADKDHPFIPDHPVCVPVNALVTSSNLSATDISRLKNYSVIKIKCPKNVIKSCLNTIKSLQKRLNNQPTFIIDANQSWSLSDSDLSGLSELSIAYVEEPCRSIEENEKFYHKTGIPYALDESLKDFQDFNSSPLSSDLKGLKAVVIKPSCQGGLLETIDTLTFLRSLDLEAVISSAFETPLGIGYLAGLSHKHNPKQYAGLDTLRYFSKGSVLPHLTSDHGFITLDTNDFKTLTPFDITHSHV